MNTFAFACNMEAEPPDKTTQAMDTLLTERQILLWKEIDAFLDTTERGRPADVRTRRVPEGVLGTGPSAPRPRFWPRRIGPARSRACAGSGRATISATSINRLRLSGRRFAGDSGRPSWTIVWKDLESRRRGADPNPPILSARAAQEIIGARSRLLKPPAFFAFRAACLAGTASEERRPKPRGCEKLAADIAERAAAAGWNGRLRDGERP